MTILKYQCDLHGMMSLCIAMLFYLFNHVMGEIIFFKTRLSQPIGLLLDHSDSTNTYKNNECMNFYKKNSIIHTIRMI